MGSLRRCFLYGPIHLVLCVHKIWKEQWLRNPPRVFFFLVPGGARGGGIGSTFISLSCRLESCRDDVLIVRFTLAQTYILFSLPPSLCSSPWGVFSGASGSAINGPVAKECADLWPRIASNAGSIV